jgi:hypothetical protein
MLILVVISASFDAVIRDRDALNWWAPIVYASSRCL